MKKISIILLKILGIFIPIIFHFIGQLMKLHDEQWSVIILTDVIALAVVFSSVDELSKKTT